MHGCGHPGSRARPAAHSPRPRVFLVLVRLRPMSPGKPPEPVRSRARVRSPRCSCIYGELFAAIGIACTRSGGCLPIHPRCRHRCMGCPEQPQDAGWRRWRASRGDRRPTRTQLTAITPMRGARTRDHLGAATVSPGLGQASRDRPRMRSLTVEATRRWSSLHALLPKAHGELRLEPGREPRARRARLGHRLGHRSATVLRATA
jgi:hypothetical protein